MVRVCVFLLLLVSVHCSRSRDFDMSSCRLTMTCGQDASGVSGFNDGRVTGNPGKRGPKGLKGDIGEKGAKGDFREYEDEFADIKRKISGIESHKKCPRTKFHFPRDNQVTDYIRIKKAIPRMDEFTICSWFSPSSANVLTHSSLASYATSQSDNAFILYFQTNSHLEIYINGIPQSIILSAISGRTHLCVAVNTNQGWAKTYINGIFIKNSAYSSRAPISGGGALVIGQEQDSVLGGFASNQAYAGTIENFMVWYRVLTGTEIREIHSDPCRCPTDYAISLSSDEIQLEGKVTAQPTTEC